MRLGCGVRRIRGWVFSNQYAAEAGWVGRGMDTEAWPILGFKGTAWPVSGVVVGFVEGTFVD